MGLPVELLAYAENIYRRFPEEFVALGMPGLEAVFDLRLDGTKTRKIVESASEKTISITIKRWGTVPGAQSQAGYAAPGMPLPTAPPMPPMPMAPTMPAWPQGLYSQAPFPSPYGPGAYGAPLPPSQPQPFPGMMQPGGWPQPPPPQPSPPLEAHQPPSIVPAWTTAAAISATSAPGDSTSSSTNAQLSRLEAVLAALKPQVEAVLTGSGGSGVQPIEQVTEDANPTFGKSRHAASQPDPRDQSALSTPSPLRDRRRMQQLQIMAPANEKSGGERLVRDNSVKLLPQNNDGSSAEESPEKVKGLLLAGTGSSTAAGSQQQPVVQVQPQPTQSSSVNEVHSASPTANDAKIGSSSPEGSKKESKRGSMTINAVRIAKLAQDPESPRSPGKHSAWK